MVAFASESAETHTVWADARFVENSPHFKALNAATPIKLAIWSRFHANHLLEGIPPAVLLRYERQIEQIYCEPGDVIFNESDHGDALYLIADGTVQISKTGRGGQQETLTYLHAGDFFGEMALLDSDERCARATAVQKTILGRVDRPAWESLLQVAPQQVMVNFSRAAAQRLRENNRHFVEEMMRAERLSLLGATVASIIHDMRSPLTSMLSAAEFIQKKGPEESREMTEIITKSVFCMEDMAQELLDFSRGATHLHIEEVDLADLLDEVESQELTRCRLAGIQVVTDIVYSGRVTVDTRRMSRVLVNLVRNAREAMSQGGRLILRAFEERDQIQIEVEDTGCGIPEDLLPKIFEPFMTFGKKKGTGLGLAIAKSVVEAHGGRISAYSTAGRGTTFTISLPPCVVGP